MKFKEPVAINKLDSTWNGSRAVGYIEKIKRRDESGTEIIEDFVKKIEREDGTISYLFQANLRSNDTMIRLQAWSNDSNPTRAKDLANSFNDGDYVLIEGKFNEREYNEKLYREINAFKISRTTEKENPEMFVTVQLQGIIDYLDYDEQEDLLKIIIKMKRYNSEEYDEYRVVGEPNNPYVNWLMNKSPAVSVGDVIKVGCDYKNEVIKDRYGEIEGIVNRLELGKIYAYGRSKDAPKKTGFGF